jgi:ATP-dependent protease HslVU (ClpYQ) peptidase subunit
MLSNTFLSTEDQYVSVNEGNYCLRRGTWYIKCQNTFFSNVINENLNEKILVVDKTFDLKTIPVKHDVISFDKGVVRLGNGEKYRVVVI